VTCFVAERQINGFRSRELIRTLKDTGPPVHLDRGLDQQVLQSSVQVAAHYEARLGRDQRHICGRTIRAEVSHTLRQHEFAEPGIERDVGIGALEAHRLDAGRK